MPKEDSPIKNKSGDDVTKTILKKDGNLFRSPGHPHENDSLETG